MFDGALVLGEEGRKHIWKQYGLIQGTQSSVRPALQKAQFPTEN